MAKVSPLFALACMPELFPSGNQLGVWKQWIYSSISIQLPSAPTDEFVLDIQDHIEKLLDQQMCNEIPHLNHQQRINGGIVAALFRAIEEGIYEFVYEVVKTSKDLLCLIYGLKEKNALLSRRDKSFNIILHQAGRLETSTTIDRVPGAALQMQRELQWFKEVERIVDPHLKNGFNDKGLTPRKWFTKNHQVLKEKGEAWMKDTATSYIVVSAFIITIMFATAFTIPVGGLLIDMFKSTYGSSIFDRNMKPWF
ncbi:hypothetical protein CJ030_MR2G023032 [Morella rubra]|uniref:PGG domain-containing protein n=1 Tax=Morella rubra TaxID=262757 RepID=A0A6A1WEB8_9ROSI|nr:hypothetical protein CJ030_MR2G023032 [Morella rubra]